MGNGESTQDYDHSDSVLALTPELTLVDSFSPAEWAGDNAHDRDLGSMGPTVVGDRVFADGKRGVGYVLDLHRLGGIGGRLSQQQVCAAYGGSAVDGATVYVPCPDGIQAVDIDAAGRVTVRWQASVRAAGSPVVGDGAVRTIDTSTVLLDAPDSATGAIRAQIPLGAVPHFDSPTLAGDRVYAGTITGVVAIAGA